MWELLSFVLFGAMMFVVGGSAIASNWEKRAAETGMFEHKGRWYRVTRVGEPQRSAAEGRRRGHIALHAEHLTDVERAAVLSILKEQGGDECSARDIAAAVAEFDKRRASEDRA
jgi:hypothetical protein